jgi:hypothetical protein
MGGTTDEAKSGPKIKILLNQDARRQTGTFDRRCVRRADVIKITQFMECSAEMVFAPSY